FVNAQTQINPNGPKYGKCDCSLLDYGCKSRPCFLDCQRVCTIIMIKPTVITISGTQNIFAPPFDAPGSPAKAFQEQKMQALNDETSWNKIEDNRNSLSPAVYFIRPKSQSHSEKIGC